MSFSNSEQESEVTELSEEVGCSSGDFFLVSSEASARRSALKERGLAPCEPLPAGLPVGVST